MLFPVSGVEIAPWIPPAVAFVIAFLGSMAGLSGAFLLLPFQMSVLGFTSAGVSPTNLIYNMVGTPAGVWTYVREKRMFWPLALAIMVGQMPGMFIGIFLRLQYLPDARSFKVFVAIVLLLVLCNLIRTMVGKRKKPVGHRLPGWGVVESCQWSRRQLSCVFEDVSYTVSTVPLLAVSFCIGVVGGAYGIGGAAFLAPLLVTSFRLPVYIIAGSTLFANAVASTIAVLVYQFVAPRFGYADARPDWILGLLFGAGGIVGMYCGARAQKHVPALWIKVILGAGVTFVAVRYLYEGWYG